MPEGIRSDGIQRTVSILNMGDNQNLKIDA
jgi:hypothetical protein